MSVGLNFVVSTVTAISYLNQSESACVDVERLDALCVQLGPQGAEDVVRGAMEELALRLSHAERLFREDDRAGLRNSADSLSKVADQIGMHKLTRVASDVINAIDHSNEVAIAATLARLMRVGERSLFDIWDFQDISV